jgi:hypothetical protein
MILGGASGILNELDTASKTLTLERRSRLEKYEYEGSEMPQSWVSLIGKPVALWLRDFLVIDITERTDSSSESGAG